MIKSTIYELKRLVSQAISETEDRLNHYPKYGVYLHAKSQLSFIKNIIDKSKVVSEEDKKLINIGIMAVKELDSTEISSKFKEL